MNRKRAIIIKVTEVWRNKPYFNSADPPLIDKDFKSMPPVRIPTISINKFSTTEVTIATKEGTNNNTYSKVKYITADNKIFKVF